MTANLALMAINRTIHHLAVYFSLLFLSLLSFGEGTKQLTPTFGDHGSLQIFATGTSRPFASQLAGPEERLYITVCDPSETIYIGLRQSDEDTYFQVKDPDGNIVYGPAIIPVNGEEGYCETYAEACAGPEELVGAAGYDAIEIDPTMAGDYYIEFNPITPNYIDANTNAKRRVLMYIDITVGNSSNEIELGRLWSREWDITCNSFSNRFEGSMYIYAADSIVTAIDFNGIQPYYFTISCNETGLLNTGDTYNDRQSREGNITAPDYRIFLNDPDEDCYPTGTFGGINGDITVTGCDPTNRTINIPVDKTGSVEITLDFNEIDGYQENTTDRLFSASVVAGNNAITWDGRDGLGNLQIGSGTIPLIVDYFNGLTHLPIYDVENHTNGFTVELVRPSNGTVPEMFWDDSRLTDGTVELDDGCPGADGCHGYDNDNPSYHWGNVRTISTWWYASVVRDSAEFVNDSTISATAHFFDATIETKDTIICKSESSIPLVGEIANAGGGLWSTTGDGNISSTTSLNPTYTFGATDKDQDSIIFILETTGNGICDADRDTITLRFQDIPTVDPGDDQTLCANNAVVAINASVENAGGVVWSGGTGNYTPNDSSQSISYEPSQSEIDGGTLTLTVTTLDNGVCDADAQDITITLNPGPVVDAGDPISVCIDNPAVTLSGSVSNATGGIWSGGVGSFDDTTNLNATYTPDGSEVIEGDSVILTLTSTDPLCQEVTDEVTITFTPSVTINAGDDQNVCESAEFVQLAGSVSNAGFAQWTGGNGTYTPSDTSLDATYEPTQAERDAGSLDLILTSQDNGTCNNNSDTVTISFTNEPTLDAGDNESICANNAEAVLDGTSANAATTQWIAAGTFIPSNTDLNATYIPSDAEINDQVAAVVLQAEGIDDCPTLNDTVLIIISPAPEVDAGLNDTVCENNADVALSGTLQNGAASFWSGGAGSFSPDTTDLEVTYTPTEDEIEDGIVQLYLSGFRTKCITVVDTINVFFSDAPEVDAGLLTSVCSNNPDVTLSGAIVRADSGTWSGGNGSFSPSADSLNTVYTPTDAEVTSGSMQLILTSRDGGFCSPVNDTIDIVFTPSPTIDAGTDFSICENVAPDSLTANVTIAGGVTWSGGTDNFSPNADESTVLYTPSDAEISSGAVTLYVDATDTSNCLSVQDSITITFTDGPTAEAGDSISVCLDDPTAQLAGSVTLATSGVWTGGNGTYSPNDTTLTATYTPTPDEIDDRTVTLTLNSADNQGCNAVTDQVVITMTEIPTVDAGSDQTVCGNSSGFVLNGAVTIASGGIWSTSGSGSFSNDSLLNATYVPSAADVLTDSIYLTLTTTGNGLCNPVSDSIVVRFQDAPTVDAGPDFTSCTNDLPAELEGSGSPATWSGGNGTFSPDNSTLNATYTPTSQDTIDGSITLTLTTVPNGSCASITDEVVITFQNGPVVSAGQDQTLCGDVDEVNLNGASAFAGVTTWTTNGSGTIDNDANTITTYTPTADDTTTGSILFFLTTSDHDPCPAERDTLVVSFTSSPTIDAGPNQTLCADADTISLNAEITVSTGAQWSTSGTGDFEDNEDLQGSYLPSSADTTTGSVTLTLTSFGSGTCQEVTDNFTITFTPAPSIEAGDPTTICADSSGIELGGSVSVSTGGRWSSPTGGLFSPNAFDLNAIYQPTTTDTTNRTVTLTLESTGNGTCQTVTDTVVITINPAPVVNAGTDFNICADSAGIVLTGTIFNATGGTWASSGTGTYSPTNNADSSFYTLTEDDLAAGFVSFTLTSTGNGLCNEVSDQVIATIGPAPTVSAGLDQSVCANVTEVAISASITTAGGINWSTLGTGSFDDENALSTNYLPSAVDTAAGTVDLVASTSDNGNCKVTRDTVQITLEPVPTIEAGDDQVVCADTADITLGGSFGNTPEASWSTSGSGQFFLNEFDVTGTYELSDADITRGNVTLTLTTAGVGNCDDISDSILITVNPQPTVSAGNDVTICADSAGIQLSGVITVAEGGIWTTSGSGTFSPNDTVLTPTYIPSATDTAAGTIVLTLTTTGNDLCNAVSDQMTLTIDPAPVLSTLGDRVICESETSVPMGGSFANVGGVVWTTTGNGIFSPSTTTADASYLLSSNDVDLAPLQMVVTTTDNGLCNAISDTLLIAIEELPVVEAGDDQGICADLAGTDISGTLSNATGVQWTSSGSGDFFPNATSIDATYAPSQADMDSGTVVLTLTSVGNGNCPAASDSLTLAIRPIPTVDAGTDIEVCENFDFVTFDATVENADSLLWTSSGVGFFGDASVEDASYNDGDPDGDEAGTTLSFTLTASAGTCQPVSDQVLVQITPESTIDAGSDQTLCTDTDTLNLSANVENAGGIFWETSGTGVFVPSTDSLVTNYIPSDLDKASDTVYLKATTTFVGACSPQDDLIALTFESVLTIDAGPDTITTCTGDFPVQLEGSGAQGVWSNGNGEFSPNTTALNALYTPSVGEEATGVTLIVTSTNVGTCAPVSDSVRLEFIEGPQVDAGGDQTVCADTAGVELGASVLIAGGAVWESSGSGTFSPDSVTIGATYIPSEEDITNALVTLTLTSTDNGICEAQTDRAQITITPIPTVFAGFDQSQCADSDTFDLSGTITVIDSAQWNPIGGDGIFTPSQDSLTAQYIYGPGDSTAGSVTMLLQSVDHGLCQQIVDTVILEITPAVTISIADLPTICEDSDEIELDDSVTVANGVSWTSSGSGTFIPSSTGNDPVYVFSDADKDNGGVTFTVESVDNGDCIARQDTASIVIEPAPTVDAGTDIITICENTPSADLNGVVTVASGGLWTTSGTGTFSADTALDATYFPSQADIDAGAMTITLTSTGNGLCQPTSDNLTIVVIENSDVVADAGSDQTVCADIDAIQLNGGVEVALSGLWTTTGDGTFSPSNSSLNAEYIPTANDTANGSVTFILTTTENGICEAETDTVVVNITPAPILTVAEDSSICADADGLVISSSATIASGVTWATTGTGSFSPSENDFTPFYEVSDDDRELGSVGFTATTTGNGTCNAVTEDFELTITTAPTISVGDDQEVCANFGETTVQASQTIASGIVWSASGDGTFEDSTSNITQYFFSDQDLTNGLVTLTATTSGNGFCNAVTDELTLTLPPTAIMNAGSDQLVCATTTSIEVSGTAQNTTQVLWNTLGSGSFVSASSGATSYIPSASDVSQDSILLVFATDDDCNTESDSVTIYFQQAPVVTTASEAICALDSINLIGTVTNATGGGWTTTGTGNFSPNAFDLTATYFPSSADISAGSIELTLTSEGNGVCDGVAQSFSTDLTEPPTAEAGDDLIICTDDRTSLAATPVNDVTYLWLNVGGDTLGTSSTLTPTVSATSNFILQVTDGTGCFARDTVQVETVDPPEFVLIDQTCFDEDLTLDATVNPIPTEGEYQWYRNDVLLVDENTLTHEVSDTGEHVIGYHNGQCSHFDTTQVTPLPVIELTDVTICENGSATLLTTVIENATYEWTENGTTIGSTNPFVVSGIVDSTTYLVSVSDSLGCQTVDSMQVATVPEPTMQLADTTNCEGQELILIGTPSNSVSDSAVYTWTLDGATLTETNDSLATTEAGDYTVTYTLDQCIASASGTVTFNPVPVPENESEVVFCADEGEIAQLDAGPADSLIWQHNLSNAQIIETSEAGVFYVELYNTFGCLTLDSIIATNICGPIVNIPTGFVPGSSITEDQQLQFFGKFIDEFSFTVYNRWGEVIYHTDDVNGQWDGTYKGKPMPAGVYPYLVRYTGVSEDFPDEISEQGKITLVR